MKRLLPQVLLALLAAVALGEFWIIWQLQGQLGGAGASLRAANESLAASRAEVSRLLPLAAQARQMPVAVAKRKAMTGPGEVVVLENISHAPLRVSVTLAGGGQRKTFPLVLDPGRPAQIGHAEGWPVAVGDKVEVVSEGYDPIRKNIAD